MTRSGRSPAQIDADVARLQEGIRRARASAGAAGGAGPSTERAAYQDAIADVARATRELVEYEDRIPEYEREYRQYIGARLTRWAGGTLAGLCMALALAVLPGAVSAPWLFLCGPLFLAGVIVLPGAHGRAADPRHRPRLGAWLFAITAVIAALCCGGAAPPWASPVAIVAAWLGLRAFGVVTPATSAATAPAGYSRTGADT